MMNLVGELVLTRNQILATFTDADSSLLGRRLDMVTTDLREAVMKARAHATRRATSFSRFPRLIRDLALGLNKRVRLEMEGQDTELDKSLLEAIRDPLTHSLRNAIDHGIEAPHLRVACGKQPEGIVRLRAYQEGSHVVVEVQDDGAGINIDKISFQSNRAANTHSRQSRRAERPGSPAAHLCAWLLHCYCRNQRFGPRSGYGCCAH